MAGVLRPSPKNVGVVLLAGGKGTGRNAAMPKLFTLLGKPVFLRSLDIFRVMTSVVNIVIVWMSPRDEYQHKLTQIAELDGQIQQGASRLCVQWFK